MIDQASLNKYITELNNLSKKKLVNIIISLTADVTYNDGFGSATADHDWSHATFGVSTGIALGELTFTPAVYYQSSFEDSVNTEDELWVSLSLAYSF